ncbi:Peptidase M16 inactive domain family protein [gamma proteobacterium NOR5-3]|nr:Peptidase M16 inactive domain family protein [gamma proteobacterium NOR5-3]
MMALKHNITVGLKATVLLAGIMGTAVAAAQDTTHPQAMGLAETQFERPDPESLQVTLDNGLVAYIAEDHRAPLVTLKAYIGVGTGHGAPGEAAALAAALRRGPQSLPADDFQATLDSMNAEFSVSQSHELTEVFLDVPANDRAQALTLLGQLLSEPRFEGPQTGPQERKSSASIDYNYSLVNAVAMFEDQLFAGHRFSPSATAEQSVAASQGARALHARYVVGQNITAAIAGDFKRSAAVKDTRRALKSLSAARPPAAQSFAALQPATQRELILSQAERIQGWIVIGHELPLVPEEDEAALAVMDYILGAYHLDSRLYRSSRELRGLTNDNSSFLKPGIRGPGSYSFRTYGRPEAVRLLVDLTFKELNTMRETLPTATELFVAKGALVDGIYADHYATGVEATQAYAREWLTEGSHERSESFPSRVAAVTAEAVREAAQKYIHPQRMVVAVLGPLDKIKAAPAIESEPQLSVWGAPPSR